MFGIINFEKPDVKEFVPQSDAPVVIEGAEIINRLCPVNPLTGKRQNVVETLMSLESNPEMRYALGKILQDLPTIKSDPNLDDEGRIMLLTERLSTGTPSEDEINAERISEIADTLFRGAPQAAPLVVQQAVKDGDVKPSAPPSEPISTSE